MKNKSPVNGNGRLNTSIRVTEAQLKLMDTLKGVLGYSNRGNLLVDFLVESLQEKYTDNPVIDAALRQYEAESNPASVKQLA